MDQHISELIRLLEKRLEHFKQSLNEETITSRENLYQEFLQQLLSIRQTLQTIKKDIEEIKKIEEKQSHYVVIKDESYLLDKKHQVNGFLRELELTIQIIEQHPSRIDLKKHIMDDFWHQVENMMRFIQTILADDKQLRLIYKGIKNL
ncbi:MAG: hypothetical protein ACOCQQ_02095 [Candidatus Nanoarchaeia archaeon]